jgi:hypothetical protein
VGPKAALVDYSRTAEPLQTSFLKLQGSVCNFAGPCFSGVPIPDSALSNQIITINNHVSASSAKAVAAAALRLLL